MISKHTFVAGSHSSTGTVPETVVPSQFPPFKMISQSSPSERPVIIIVPLTSLAGSSPNTEPVDVVVTEVMLASDPV